MPVLFKTTARIDLTADEWQLYASSMDCTAAATALNRALTDAINTSDTVREALSKFFPVAQQYRAFGRASCPAFDE